MYSLFYKLYFALRRTQKKHIDDKDTLYRFSTFLIGYIEAYYNLHVVKQFRNKPSHEKGVTEIKREQKVIISLTSFPARINVVWIAIETLMRQSTKPDEIILWLAREQFPSEDKLPTELIKQKERGLTIRFCDDLKSHKKYFYVMQEYPEDLIILADDDLFYPADTISMLFELHNSYPKDICCITSQHIGRDWNTLPSTWQNPYLSDVNEHSKELQVFTGSGSLFPPHSLYKDVFDKEKMMELCLTADDLWLTIMARLQGTRVTSLNKWRAFPVEIYGTSKNSLWHVNAENGMNDLQWTKMMKYYKENATWK